ncbi:hypothetical protein CL614_07745 [archaeon]|nr:hypothetical protein [archaeon]
MMKTEEMVDMFYPNGLDDLANTIGPQGNLLAKLDNFNHKYCYDGIEEPLRITKKWRWSPGTYDKVKVCYTRKIMQWHRRPRHMHSIFDRRREWYSNDMKRELCEIENALIASRRENAVWLDENTDDGILEQAIYEFTSRINELMATASLNDITTTFGQARRCDINNNIYRGYGATQREDPNTDLVEGLFIFTFEFKPKPLRITREGLDIGHIDFPPLTFCIQISIGKWIWSILNPDLQPPSIYNSQHLIFGLNYDVPKDLIIPEAEGMILKSERPIWHPFMNRPDRGPTFRQTDGRIFSWQNICMGNHQDDIVRSWMRMDWHAFFYHLQEWLFKYEIINANPLNNIRFSFIGLDEDMNTELLDAVGYSGKWCAERLTCVFKDRLPGEVVLNPHKEVINFCDNIRKCSHRKKCDGYKLHMNELKKEESLDDDKKEMLKWASQVSGGRVGKPASSFEDVLADNA